MISVVAQHSQHTRGWLVWASAGPKHRMEACVSMVIGSHGGQVVLVSLRSNLNWCVDLGIKPKGSHAMGWWVMGLLWMKCAIWDTNYGTHLGILNIWMRQPGSVPKLICSIYIRGGIRKKEGSIIWSSRKHNTSHNTIFGCSLSGKVWGSEIRKQ